jgi:hypothetical protein
MARKSITDLKSSDKLVKEAIARQKSISEVKYEIAREAFDLQDDKTKEVIDRMVETLRNYTTGYINVQLQPPTGALVPVRLDNEYLGYNLLFLAVEIVKDLALLDIKVANFKFPPSMCVKCGAELGIPEQTRGAK